jgi:hypothetical protein
MNLHPAPYRGDRTGSADRSYGQLSHLIFLLAYTGQLSLSGTGSTSLGTILMASLATVPSQLLLRRRWALPICFLALPTRKSDSAGEADNTDCDRLLTLDTNFRIPIYRDYALAMGLGSVSKESIENLLSKGGVNGEGMGRAVTIVVGGARESLNAEPHSLRLVLNSRKGFVKLAIRQGADLVPVLAFGENDLYEQIDSEEHPWIHKTQMMVKKVAGFTVPLFHARGIFNYDVGMMPYRRAVNIVVGRPIEVVQQGQKDGRVPDDYLDEIHTKYVEELRRLWDEHKDLFAKDRESEMELVE